MKNKIALFVGTAVILLAGFLVVMNFYNQAQKEEIGFLSEEKSEVFVREYSPRYGSEEARVILTEFLDPECESCRAFYPKVKSLLKEYDPKVQLVVRYAPFHGNSQKAIKALEAARMQGKYWEALETLFRHQPKWGSHHNPRPELIFEYLSRLDLDMEKLREDMDSKRIQKIIEQDVEDLRALNVRATPSFFVNGKPLQNFGAQYLRDLIEQEIKKEYPES